MYQQKLRSRLLNLWGLKFNFNVGYRTDVLSTHWLIWLCAASYGRASMNHLVGVDIFPAIFERCIISGSRPECNLELFALKSGLYVVRACDGRLALPD